MKTLLRAQLLNTGSSPFETGKDSFLVHGMTMKFPYQVWSALELKDRIIVGYDYDELKAIDPKFEFWRAVFCYDLEGKVLWQVEPPYYIDNVTGKKIICENGEGAIQRVAYLEKEDKVVVYGRVGYEVDINTGKLGEIVYRER